MKNTIVKIACFASVAVALTDMPAISQTDVSTNIPAARTPAPVKRSVIHGKVVALDATAMTFTVGSTTIAITSNTKISKAGKPAVFADITAGETVASAYKKDDAGKLIAISLRIGGKKKKDVTVPACVFRRISDSNPILAGQ
jgi:hypothetical protein